MRHAVVVLALLAGACAARAPVAPVVDDSRPRIAAADELVRVGCYTCLLEALQEYEGVLTRSPTPHPEAAAGAVRAALLLDFRQRELGMVDDGYRARAEAIITERGLDRERYALWFDTLDLLGWPYPRPGEDPAAVTALGTRQVNVRRNLDAELEQRRSRAEEDPLATYAWVAFYCAYGPQPRSADLARAPLTATRTMMLIDYAVALCGSTDIKTMTSVGELEPRFLEADYWLGRSAVAATDVEGAEKRLTRVYESHPRWPTLTVTLGHVSMAFEDMERARVLYEETLALAPDYPDALLGHVRALGYLGRHQDALAALDQIAARKTGVFAGEAFYWRAWNLSALDRLDEAWESVERAHALWRNNEVAKLAGIIAYRRRQLDVSYARFSEARKIDASDCEVLYNLGQIDAEERRWQEASATLPSAASCLERLRQTFQKEIAELRAKPTDAPVRQARQIANREARIVAATRMLETAWFNMALTNFSLSRSDEARRYAERLAEHPLFGERAKEILTRLSR